MMIKLVNELRASAPPGKHVGDCMIRAADEIVRLRTALERCLDAAAAGDCDGYVFSVANSALNGDGGEDGEDESR